MITYDDIGEAMEYINEVGGPAAYTETIQLDEGGAYQAADIGTFQLTEEGQVDAIVFGREMFMGGLLAGYRLAQAACEEALGPEDADRIATGRGGVDEG